CSALTTSAFWVLSTCFSYQRARGTIRALPCDTQRCPRVQTRSAKAFAFEFRFSPCLCWNIKSPQFSLGGHQQSRTGHPGDRPPETCTLRGRFAAPQGDELTPFPSC